MSRNGALKTAGAVLAMVGSVAAGVWALDNQYARRTDLTLHVQQHAEEVKDIKQLILQQTRRGIVRDLFQLGEEASHRPLTQPERERLNELQDDLRGVNQQLRGVP